jgi:uncharacterized glyoxalase superfamily protein PhnB
MPAKLTSIAPVLIVRDMQASLKYWRDKVGFDVSRQFGEPVNFAMPNRDGITIMLAQSKAEVDVPVPNWRVQDKTNNIYIWVDDAKSLYHELIERGAIIDYTMYDTPWGTREFGIQDLDDRDITFGQVIR